MYIILFVNVMVDFYIMKKFLHKLAHKYTNKELKSEYKALKKQKKQWKIQNLNQMMMQMTTKAQKDVFMATRSAKERKMWEKENARIMKLRIYQNMQANQQAQM